MKLSKEREREFIFVLLCFILVGQCPCCVLRYGERKSKLYILNASSIVLNLLYISFSLYDELITWLVICLRPETVLNIMV